MNEVQQLIVSAIEEIDSLTYLTMFSNGGITDCPVDDISLDSALIGAGLCASVFLHSDVVPNCRNDVSQKFFSMVFSNTVWNVMSKDFHLCRLLFRHLIFTDQLCINNQTSFPRMHSVTVNRMLLVASSDFIALSKN